MSSSRLHVTEISEQGRVLAFSGSVRTGSWNGRLLAVRAADLELEGLKVTRLDLWDYPMPLYDGDLEAARGLPVEGIALRRLLMQHQGMLIACPEHNGSVTARLKNTLDWCSRPAEGVEGLAPFYRKPVMIVGTSVSPFGALRAIGHLRAILGKMGALVLPEDLAIPSAATSFEPDGSLTDAGHRTASKRIADAFAEFLY